MAVRRPVKWNGTGFIDLSNGEMTAIQNEAVRLYGANPSVVLSVVSSGGSLGTISDTRLQAGTGTTDATNFDTEAELQDVSTVTVNYSRMDESTSSVTLDNAGFSWPLYRVSGGLRAMSETDFYDTFIDNAIGSLTDVDGGSNRAGTYTISTSSTLSGATEVSGSATPIFTDTRANADAYTADGLIETRDQPENITNYYLHRYNAGAANDFSKVVCHGIGSTDATFMSQADFRTQLGSGVRHFMTQEVSYNLSSGTSRGTIITDTARTSAKYLTFQAGADDYRAQEVPDYDASASSINTYRLYILRS